MEYVKETLMKKVDGTAEEYLSSHKGIIELLFELESYVRTELSTTCVSTGKGKYLQSLMEDICGWQSVVESVPHKAYTTGQVEIDQAVASWRARARELEAENKSIKEMHRRMVRRIRDAVGTELNPSKDETLCKTLMKGTGTLNLSIRTHNVLSFAGKDTIGDVARMSKKELMSMKGLGKKAVDELEKALQQQGVTLGMDVDKVLRDCV